MPVVVAPGSEVRLASASASASAWAAGPGGPGDEGGGSSGAWRTAAAADPGGGRGGGGGGAEAADGAPGEVVLEEETIEGGGGAEASTAEAEAVRAMAELGLPTGFAGDARSGEGAAEYAAAEGQPVWRQAFDAAARRYYFYSEALQSTQWDPPADGRFVPAPWEWSAERFALVRLAELRAEQAPPRRAPASGDVEERADPFGPEQHPRRNPRIRKYWHQRHALFAEYDRGVLLDEEGWFSVTPEAVAQHQAARAVGGGSGAVVVDAFGGVGGNAIQFALAGCHVVCMDLDALRLDLAQHNAAIYGVAGRVDFVCGDFLRVSERRAPATRSTEARGALTWPLAPPTPTLRVSHSLQSRFAGGAADLVFLSPPWGGPEYLASERFDPHELGGLDGRAVLAAARRMAPRAALFLPRNVDEGRLEALAEASGVAELQVERIVLDGRPKAVTAYLRWSAEG